MTRVSLKEAYDNKDVVAQIFAIKDTANGAEETANNASTTANEAKTHVDTVAVDVERAVNTANRASESAQESARVVAGYDARLTTAEGTIQSQGTEIQHLGIETRDLYDRDANNVKVDVDHPQNVVNGLRSAVIPSVDEDYVNMKYVESTDAGANNLVHKTGGEYLEHQANGRRYITTTSGSNRWRELYRWSGRFIGVVRVLSTRIQINDIVSYGRDDHYLKWGSEHYTESELNPRIYRNDDGSFSLWVKIRYSDVTLAQLLGDYIGDVKAGTETSASTDDIPGTLIRELTE